MNLRKDHYRTNANARCAAAALEQRIIANRPAGPQSRRCCWLTVTISRRGTCPGRPFVRTAGGSSRVARFKETVRPSSSTMTAAPSHRLSAPFRRRLHSLSQSQSRPRSHGTARPLVARASRSETTTRRRQKARGTNNSKRWITRLVCR